MTFGDVWDHIQQNWHKYGILYLVLKDVKDTYKVVSKVKSFQETFAWVWKKIKSPFTKKP